MFPILSLELIGLVILAVVIPLFGFYGIQVDEGRNSQREGRVKVSFKNLTQHQHALSSFLGTRRGGLKQSVAVKIATGEVTVAILAIFFQLPFKTAIGVSNVCV